MHVFTFFKHRREHDVPEFELEDLADLEAAKDHARGLIAREGHEAVEIFDGEHSVRVSKEDFTLPV